MILNDKKAIISITKPILLSLRSFIAYLVNAPYKCRRKARNISFYYIFVIWILSQRVEETEIYLLGILLYAFYESYQLKIDIDICLENEVCFELMDSRSFDIDKEA